MQGDSNCVAVVPVLSPACALSAQSQILGKEKGLGGSGVVGDVEGLSKVKSARGREEGLPVPWMGIKEQT